jgi:hypothetical protein
MEIIFRHFPCDAHGCSNYIEVPTHIAKKVMKPNGTIMPHVEVLCRSCQDWWSWNIDYGTQAELEYFLPPPR